MKPIPDPVLLDIRVKPRAKRAGILGRHGSALKVAVRAAPERGRANAELVQVLAQALGLPAAAFELVAGATSQDKRVRVSGVTAEDLSHRIDAAVERE
jgi:uncharacterized protein (TIGR00251 family)